MGSLHTCDFVGGLPINSKLIARILATKDIKFVAYEVRFNLKLIDM